MSLLLKNRKCKNKRKIFIEANNKKIDYRLTKISIQI